jgi:hypothetical protein
MTTPTSLSAFSMNVDNQTVNAIATYTFTITFQTKHYSGDKIYLTFPQ